MILTTMLLCIAGTAGNYGLIRLSGGLGLGLFLDTVFTVMVTFSGGVWAGIVTALLSQATYSFADSYSWVYYLFSICSIASALLTRLFMRLFPKECAPVRLFNGRSPPERTAAEQPGKDSFFARMIMLFLLSLSMCVLISVLGGLIAAFLGLVLRSPVSDAPPETYFKLGLLRQGLSLTAAEILARLPVNLVDRFISVFGAYGVSLLLKRALQRKKPTKIY